MCSGSVGLRDFRPWCIDEPLLFCIDLCASGGGGGDGVSGMRALTCRVVFSPVLRCESGITLVSGFRPLPRAGLPIPRSRSQEGTGWSGSRSETLCLLFGLYALEGLGLFGRGLPSLSLLRFIFAGSNRRADVGGTESRIPGIDEACMIRIIAVVGNKLPRISLWVTSNSWSS